MVTIAECEFLYLEHERPENIVLARHPRIFFIQDTQVRMRVRLQDYGGGVAAYTTDYLRKKEQRDKRERARPLWGRKKISVMPMELHSSVNLELKLTEFARERVLEALARRVPMSVEADETHGFVLLHDPLFGKGKPQLQELVATLPARVRDFVTMASDASITTYERNGPYRLLDEKPVPRAHFG